MFMERYSECQKTNTSDISEYHSRRQEMPSYEEYTCDALKKFKTN